MTPPPLLLSFNLIVLGAIAILLTDWYVQRRTLRRIISGTVGPIADPRTAVYWFAGWIHSNVPRRQDPLFVSPLFHVLGASPIAVLRSGGCCSGLARLYILGLDSLGIRAAQITLYHTSGCAQHCAVEVTLGIDRMVVDPRYGLYYTGSDGSPLGLDALQTGRQPMLQTLPLCTATAYPPSPYYNFNYQNTKTANWTRSVTRRTAYRVLNKVSAGRVDRLRVPAILEWPQILLSSVLLSGAGLLDLVLLAV